MSASKLEGLLRVNCSLGKITTVNLRLEHEVAEPSKGQPNHESMGVVASIMVNFKH